MLLFFKKVLRFFIKDKFFVFENFEEFDIIINKFILYILIR